MIKKLKTVYIERVEKPISQHFPAWAVVLLLPIRFNIPLNMTVKGDPEKAVRYIDLVCRRRKDISAVLELDKQCRGLGKSGLHICETLSDKALEALLAEKPAQLSSLAKSLSSLGRFRVAAVLRAILLLRLAMDNNASGKGAGQRYDTTLLEISVNDFCRVIIDRTTVVEDDVMKQVRHQVREVSTWPLDRKISTFIDKNAKTDLDRAAHLRGKSVKIQGPSSRPSDLDDLSADFTAVVGYAGEESLVRPVKRIDLSMYLPHKIRQLDGKGRLEVLQDVGLFVISRRPNEDGAELCDAVLETYDGVYSSIRAANCHSIFNGGVEFFLWMIAAGASKIGITNFDMFTNPVYPSGYVANRPERMLERDEGTWRMKAEVVTGTFTSHDPSQQFSIYKIFADCDGIKYDQVLRDIVSKPLSSYIEKLESLYGEAG